LARYGAAGMPSIGSLEAAVFALLGSLIAFTFSGALQHFDLRRAQAADEANGIGTAYLHIDLLPASAQPALREIFRNYVDARTMDATGWPSFSSGVAETGRLPA